MNLKIEKRHNEHIIITQNDEVLSIKGLIIEARVKKPVHVTRMESDKVEICTPSEESDELKVILTYSNGVVKSLNNKTDNINLDMEFGGGYVLMTDGMKDVLSKRITFKYCDMLLGRIQWLRYEINTDITYGKMEMEIMLT